MATMPDFSTLHVAEILNAAGWVPEKKAQGNGSGHQQFEHEFLPGKVTLPTGGNHKYVTPKTLENIFQQAGLGEEFSRMKKGGAKGAPVKVLKKQAKEKLRAMQNAALH